MCCHYETGLSLWFKVLEKKKKSLWAGYWLIKWHVVLIITACILIIKILLKWKNAFKMDKRSVWGPLKKNKIKIKPY